MKQLRSVVCAALALMLSLASWARAQVLQAVPSESIIVIKIKNLADVSQKVGMLSEQWGLTNMIPELKDPLTSLLTMANLGAGLNKNGEAALAVLDAGDGRQPPKAVFLLSVTDYKAFSAALPNAKPDGDLTTFKMGNSPDIFVANWGNYAAVSPDKALLAQKGAGVQVAGVTAKELNSKDLIAWVNFKAIRKDLLPMIQQGKGEFLQMMDQAFGNAPGMDPKFAPALKAYLGQFINVAEQFVNDADSATFGINLAKEGISTTLMAEFVPDSYIGKFVANSKSTDESFTAGLPEGKYFVYGGFKVGPAGIQVMNDFIAPIEKEIVKLGADGKALADYIGAMKDYMAATKSAVMGLVAPPGAAIGNQQGAIQIISIATGDAGKIMESQTKMLALQGEMMKLTPGMGNIVKATHTPAAKTIEGVKFDQFSLTYGQANTPQEQQAIFMMKMMYGPNGLNGLVGAIDGTRVVTSMGVSDEVLTAAVKSLKAGQDPLAKQAGRVAAGLPANRLGVLYVPLDVIFTTVTDVMAAQGMPAGVKLPPNLPPVGVALSTEGTAFKIESHIPSALVESMISAGLQLYLKQMPGGGAQPGL